MFNFRYLLNTLIGIIFGGTFSLGLQQTVIAKQPDMPVQTITSDVTVNSNSTSEKISSNAATKTLPLGNFGNVANNSPLPVSPSANPPLSCPQPTELIKRELNWMTKDGKWKNYTPSAATKILNFLGAQWVGIKLGDIICLYQTDEAVSFPLELEQTNIRSILEPKSSGWSVLVGNRKICKSSSVADCQYLLEPPKDTSNIYKDIEYAPSRRY